MSKDTAAGVVVHDARAGNCTRAPVVYPASGSMVGRFAIPGGRDEGRGAARVAGRDARPGRRPLCRPDHRPLHWPLLMVEMKATVAGTNRRPSRLARMMCEVKADFDGRNEGHFCRPVSTAQAMAETKAEARAGAGGVVVRRVAERGRDVLGQLKKSGPHVRPASSVTARC